MINNNIFDQAKDLAEKIRRDLALGSSPIKNIFSWLEDQGVFVVRMPIEGNSLSGAFYHDKNKKTSQILINTNRTEGHQVCTAAHEFCHYLLDKEDQFIVEHDSQEKSPKEQRADAFAVNFLLPENGLRFYIQSILRKTKKLDDDDLVRIRNEFGTSWSATIYRLHNLGYIFDKGLKSKLEEICFLNSMAIQFGFEPETSMSGTIYEFSSNFYRLAFVAYFKRKISFNRLSDLLRRSQENTKELITKIENIHE